MFQFNPYASYETARLEREQRQQRLSLLASARVARLPRGHSRWRDAVYALGLLFTRVGACLQRRSGMEFLP